MIDGVLSQQEINNLLRKSKEVDIEMELSEAERDLLGEVGNISMATAATTLSTILSQKVEITTPQVTLTTLSEIQEAMTIPNVVFQVKFTEGLEGSNVLLISVPDASIIANLMMGGDGTNPSLELSDLELSAVSEAMNQMIGSASTSIATMMKRDINITPPSTQIWNGDEVIVIDGIDPDQPIVKVAFRMTVTNLIDSHIMQIFNLDTVKDITNCLLGDSMETENQSETRNDELLKQEPDSDLQSKATLAKNIMEQPVAVQKPSFAEIQNKPAAEKPRNIDLIMDVPLEFSVVLGKTKRTIKEVLSLSPGSVVELEKTAEEPLEVYVNGKLLAQGEVVVINENFGIRITNIISASERVKSLK
ncbi:MAG TPA: flagellar motor switch phosphatase FliY [Clostridiales bacterium]|nr:flagellar motor switch phosphatase FliY [Clostridiales bacterium]